MVYRVYVEKKPPYAVEAKALLQELRDLVGIDGLRSLRLLNRYDVEGIDERLFDECVHTVFSEPPVDEVYFDLPVAGAALGVEYLPGQFDQRADSAAECIQLISQGARPAVRSARIYLLEGDIGTEQLLAIRNYLINPVEAQEAALELPETLLLAQPAPPSVPVLEGFCALEATQLPAFVQQYGLAMDSEDLAFCQRYFLQEGRDPSLTELRMIDTYWSDHCRHTTFGTHLDTVSIEDKKTQESYQLYIDLRKELGFAETRPQTLMDMGTIAAKAQKRRGVLQGLDESDEINACSVRINAEVDGKDEPWLLLFKNETHNHPTEIEPFGGAATCIGGAIRDPLANRGYVFGAMRLTGAGNPLAPVKDTLPGKLPQRKLVTGAAAGYSSYGNQIGLATGQVTELYHPGYIAKRMEVGAVLGAVRQRDVRREQPSPGDVIILLGGRTGRDGCGGATGSSKAHGAESLASCGAEVQKGNAPVERNLQRLFRNPAATRLIIRCNDFGAGGVSVAIGELADGVRIDLSAVPKKYDGLDGTELAISESQERMAVVVRPQDAEAFIQLALAENLEATPVALVSDTGRLMMEWEGELIVDISREFLNTNGAPKHAAATVPQLPLPQLATPAGSTLEARLAEMAADLNTCSQKGLAEMFDSTIGAGSVLMPFGGRMQLTPAQIMAMKLPVDGETATCAAMAFGFDPYISEQNPHTGAYLAVLESVAKLLAGGFARRDIYLSFQEYFERLHTDPLRWGKPVASLLGALQAQMDLDVAAIGGKDSMSGSFEHLDVPPTLVSFAVAAGRAENVVSAELKAPGSRLVVLRPAGSGLVPNATAFKLVAAQLQQLMRDKKVLSAWAAGRGGVAEALFKMGLGNQLGVNFAGGISMDSLFAPAYGCFVLELAQPEDIGELIGETTSRYAWTLNGETADVAAAQEAWEARLEPVLPYRGSAGGEVPLITHNAARRSSPKTGCAKPRVLIPVFPGTNCEYDTARALRRAGAVPVTYVIRNLTPQDIAKSAADIARLIDESQMIVLPGGFSGGDEPEGSAKLITAFFRGARVAEAVERLLQQRDGLMLGICNGFQALIKLGLLPFGRISPAAADSPTLTFNTIGRHQSMLCRTRIASNLSPWLMHEAPGEIHTVAISHGEGRFVASEEMLTSLAANGQLATQYIDMSSAPTMDVRYNPNGSAMAIEGITSPDGRVFGKMGHSERSGSHLYINVPGNKNQRLFEGGVDYFK